MRLFNKLEIGIHNDGIGRVVWTLFEFNKCANGCLLYDFGPFYITILKGDCGSRTFYEEI